MIIVMLQTYAPVASTATAKHHASIVRDRHEHLLDCTTGSALVSAHTASAAIRFEDG